MVIDECLCLHTYKMQCTLCSAACECSVCICIQYMCERICFCWIYMPVSILMVCSFTAFCIGTTLFSDMLLITLVLACCIPLLCCSLTTDWYIYILLFKESLTSHQFWPLGLTVLVEDSLWFVRHSAGLEVWREHHKRQAGMQEQQQQWGW